MKTYRIASRAFVVAYMGLAIQTVNANDFTATARYYVPAQDEDYDFGIGAEIQYRIWMSGNWGIAVAAGISDWIAEDQYIYSSAMINGMESDFYGDISGSVYMIPLGGGLILRQPAGDRLNLCAEAGIRYVLVESDVELDGFLGTPGVGGQPSLNEELELDDGIIGLLRADIEYLLGGSTRIVAGIGYQFDLEKGDAELFGQQTGENELEAFFVELGICVDI